MNLGHVRPATLSERDRAAVVDSLKEAKPQRRAAQMWSDAIDAGDFERARAIAAETETWFEAEDD